MKKHDIPKHILDRVEAELLSDEQLLWVGQAHPTRFLTQSAQKTHPLLTLAIALELIAFIAAVSLILLPVSLIILLGLILTTILGSLAQQYFYAKNTIYAITNQRAMTITGRDVETFGKTDLQSIQRKMKHTGRGDIIFRKDTQSRINPSAYGLMLHRQINTERGFLGIENPEHVELLLLKTFGEQANIDTHRLEDNYDTDETYDLDDVYQEASEQG